MFWFDPFKKLKSRPFKTFLVGFFTLKKGRWSSFQKCKSLLGLFLDLILYVFWRIESKKNCFWDFPTFKVSCDICGKFMYKEEGIRRHKKQEHGIDVFDPDKWMMISIYIPCSSHVNNQSWILSLPNLFVYFLRVSMMIKIEKKMPKL